MASASSARRVRAGLFVRTFLLIGALIVASVLASLQLVQVFDRSPPDQQLAWEIASLVNVTRSALVNTVGDRRAALLAELQREEDVHVLPLETPDRIEPVGAGRGDDNAFARAVEARLRAIMGPSTLLAGRVNGERGLWVSFDIDGDAYWLVMARERFDRQHGPHWGTIALMALGLSGLGGLAISQLVNRPLARLADALGRLSRGEPPPALPEDGAFEIALVNRRFNRMAGELAALESDRAVALAGISHDIRTPLARLRLEIELSSLPPGERASMADEIERIDAIVGKFLEYGRAAHAAGGARAVAVDLPEVVAGAQTAYRARMHDGTLSLAVRIDDDARWSGDPLDLGRALGNLIENAVRYGATPGTDRTDLSIRLSRTRGGLCVVVQDQGPGVAQQDRERLLRPFARADDARSQTRGGSGLGLAIVARIAQRHGGDCRLDTPEGGGLRVTLTLADAPDAAPRTATRAAPDPTET